MEKICKNLYNLRVDRRIKIETLTQECNIDIEEYKKAECGQTELSLEQLERLAKYYNLEVSDLYHRDYDIKAVKNSVGFNLIWHSLATVAIILSLILLPVMLANLKDILGIVLILSIDIIFMVYLLVDNIIKYIASIRNSKYSLISNIIDFVGLAIIYIFTFLIVFGTGYASEIVYATAFTLILSDLILIMDLSKIFPQYNGNNVPSKKVVGLSISNICVSVLTLILVLFSKIDYSVIYIGFSCDLLSVIFNEQTFASFCTLFFYLILCFEIIDTILRSYRFINASAYAKISNILNCIFLPLGLAMLIVIISNYTFRLVFLSVLLMIMFIALITIKIIIYVLTKKGLSNKENKDNKTTKEDKYDFSDIQKIEFNYLHNLYKSEIITKEQFKQAVYKIIKK